MTGICYGVVGNKGGVWSKHQRRTVWVNKPKTTKGKAGGKVRTCLEKKGGEGVWAGVCLRICCVHRCVFWGRCEGSTQLTGEVAVQLTVGI